MMWISCVQEPVSPKVQGYTAALLGIYLTILDIANKKMEHVAAVEKMSKEDIPIIIAISKQWIEANKHAFVKANSLYICGNHVNYITAQEGAIKIGETLRRVTKPQETEESAHFANLALEENDTIFFIDHHNFRHVRTNAIYQIISPITKHIYRITDTQTNNRKDCFLPMAMEDDLSVFYYVIPLQVLAALISETIGIDTSKFTYEEGKNIAHDETYLLYQTK